MLHLDTNIFPQSTQFVYDRHVMETVFTQRGDTLAELPVIPFSPPCEGKPILLLHVSWLAILLLTQFNIEAAFEETALPNAKFYGNEISLVPPTFDPCMTLRPRRQIAFQPVD